MLQEELASIQHQKAQQEMTNESDGSRKDLTMGLHNKITDLQLEIRNLKSQSAMHDEATSIREQLALAEQESLALNELLMESERARNQALSQVNQFKERTARNEHIISKLKSQNEELSRRFKEINDENLNLTIAFTKRERELARQKSLDNPGSISDATNAEVAKLEVLEHFAQDKSKLVRDLENEVQRLLEDNQKLTLNNQAEKQELYDMDEYFQKLDNEKVEMTKEIDQMAERIKILSNERDEYYSGWKSAANKPGPNHEQDEVIAKLRHELRKVNRDLQNLITQRDDLEEELKLRDEVEQD